MRTLTSEAVARGIGLFTGQNASVVFKGGPKGSGVRFISSDNDRIDALISNIRSTPIHPAFAQLSARNTSLINSRSSGVITTEHVLAALVGLGLTDVEVQLDGPELPIGDGSAVLFVEPLMAASFARTDDIEPITMRETIRVQDDRGGSITCEPASETSYAYTLDYGSTHTFLAHQSATWVLGDADDFARNIAPARTFGLIQEVEHMRTLGLFGAFTPKDLLVFGPDGPIDNELRFENEPARHKLLDLIGDLALVGRPVRAAIHAERSGHALNHELAQRIAEVTTEK